MMAGVSRALVQQLSSMGIRDERVLRAFEEVPRHLFVPGWLQDQAEADRPLPIGHGQTISQPYIVAVMTEALRLDGRERVLEIGTGSGYQTAILAQLAALVYTVEIRAELAASASSVLLGSLHLQNVHLRTDDGRRGWPEAAPFDRIIVTAAPADIPEQLVGQLAAGGLMVIPVGSDPDVQMLKVLRRGANGVDALSDLLPVRFVPLTGDAS
jgi:protein-L-isoaspartate(D-aspartate) O-methyltransferase